MSIKPDPVINSLSRPQVVEPRSGPPPAERFISHAQNLEDVLLWRALGSIGPGFYIDLGAGEPDAESVTKAFYDQGWRGINVEPMPETFARLKRGRPRDVNLMLAVEETAGKSTYFSIDGGNGLSTGSEELANGYAAAGRTVTQIEVETDSLANICRTYVSHEIHFLKIDVEGSEESVLRGADLASYRPWIIVIESPEAAAAPRAPSWHCHLDATDYRFVHYDGLNRWYIAAEKMPLLEKPFATPPTCFDNYVRYREVELEAAVDALERRLAASEEAASVRQGEMVDALERRLAASEEAASVREGQLADHLTFTDRELTECYQQLYEDSLQLGWLSAQRQQFVARIRDQEAAISELTRHVESIGRSRSWRFTEPLRRITRLLVRLRGPRGRPG